MKDLIVLVADKNMESAISGMLGRPQELGIRPITCDLFVHPRRAPGCRKEAQDFLRPFHRAYRFALVMFDHQGCGRERDQANELADRVKTNLSRNGWPDRADAVVISPELEAWVWAPSTHVETCLGWAGKSPSLRNWLANNRHWPYRSPKPPRPKEAMEAALRKVRKPRSSAIYLQLAQRVDLQGHTEPAFLRLTRTLQRCFPQRLDGV
jgi:hypothetical protein